MLLTAFPSWRLAAMNSSISSIVIASSSKATEGRDEVDARVALVVHQRRALETDELAVGEVAARELREQQPAGRAGARHGVGQRRRVLGRHGTVRAGDYRVVAHGS